MVPHFGELNIASLIFLFDQVLQLQNIQFIRCFGDSFLFFLGLVGKLIRDISLLEYKVGQIVISVEHPSENDLNVKPGNGTITGIVFRRKAYRGTVSHV